MKDEWYKLSEKYPDIALVLGFDRYRDEDRFAICETDKNWINVECNDGNKRTFIYIKNSIAPGLSDDSNCYWMPIPNDEDELWFDFDTQQNPFLGKPLQEVLIQLHNGSLYVGFIENFDWCPSFNMFKHGTLESIKKWRPLPKPPDSQEIKA